MTNARMTPLLRDTLIYIKAYTDRMGYPPSSMDMSEEFEITPSTALTRLRRLEDVGLISRVPNTPRSISLTAEGRSTLGL